MHGTDLARLWVLLSLHASQNPKNLFGHEENMSRLICRAKSVSHCRNRVDQRTNGLHYFSIRANGFPSEMPSPEGDVLCHNLFDQCAYCSRLCLMRVFYSLIACDSIDKLRRTLWIPPQLPGILKSIQWRRQGNLTRFLFAKPNYCKGPTWAASRNHKLPIIQFWQDL